MKERKYTVKGSKSRIRSLYPVRCQLHYSNLLIYTPRVSSVLFPDTGWRACNRYCTYNPANNPTSVPLHVAVPVPGCVINLQEVQGTGELMSRLGWG